METPVDEATKQTQAVAAGVELRVEFKVGLAEGTRRKSSKPARTLHINDPKREPKCRG